MPIANPGPTAPFVRNRVNKGSTVPIGFSLGGYDFGLDVIRSGFPRSVAASCETGTPMSGTSAEATSTPGNSGLNFDASTGRYNYAWRTDRTWAGTCRRLELTLRDGQTRWALFEFVD
jgi:hypothetical protein